MYFRDYKDELLKQNPQLDMEGARKILNERFNSLDDEKKAVYKKKSKKISTEYHHNVNRLLYALYFNLYMLGFQFVKLVNFFCGLGIEYLASQANLSVRLDFTSRITERSS